jgi:amidophosphoribosyltransferase
VDAANETGTSQGNLKTYERPSNFEVGVFCGTYVTPVEREYFEHLEKIRGHSRKLKAQEEARLAVASGVAEGALVDMAATGVDVDQEGKVVSAAKVNGQTPPVLRTNGIKQENDGNEEESPSVRANRMDISLHNFGDFRD